MNLANKQAELVALVTGSARRIGAAIVKRLHQEGFDVVIHCHHSHQEASELVNTLNSLRPDSAMSIACNLEDPTQLIPLIEQVNVWRGRLDLLVNNASIFIRNTDMSIQTWSALFDVNVRAPWLLSHAAHTLLKASQGSIINITDIHGDRPLKGYGVYCQTKAALMMQTKALAKEFAPEVRVNAVSPGAIDWPESDNMLSEEDKDKIINKTALKKHGHPHHIAQAVVALAANTFITGQILAVDGGRTI